ncbi:hypothetical protein CRM22_003167 [Opisthorchis felineus]|uniref:Mitochondria-eating protein n=1 Tax=Opisthorchis felineus TaxID=147828 RepID=A0A4S2M7C7_OPIFE|nr:hypothetical protein CRM22_003167 [Opisthorchis felineus]
MSNVLRQLTASSAFLILHENLEKWLTLYDKNTCDENIATGCEIIELSARLQGQLFRLLSICASEGGGYDGLGGIKSRLLPLLGSGILAAGISAPMSTFSAEEKPSASKTCKPLREKSPDGSDPVITQQEPSFVGSETECANVEKNRRKHPTRGTTQDKHFQELQSKLKSLEQENERLQNKLMQTDQGARRSAQSTGKSATRSSDSLDAYPGERISGNTHGSLNGISPLSTQDPIQRSRQQLVVMRFNELFSGGRIEAMNLLRRYSNDHDMNQSIIFNAIMESFNVARAHFRAYRNRLRTKMASTTNPPTSETLDELMQSHINVHGSFAANLPAMTQEVLLAMEQHSPRLQRPSEALGFEIISDFIHEACKLAWECSVLAHPIDVYRPAFVNEVIDDSKYRRSHDSSYSAVLVHHHIWPCLVQDGSVIAKGEVCTRRGRHSYSTRHVSPEAIKRSTSVRPHCNTRSSSPRKNSASQRSEVQPKVTRPDRRTIVGTTRH